MNLTSLKTKLDQIKDSIDENHAIRLHRAISWLRCAEKYSDKDEDIAVIALWIAFNSCYAIDEQNYSSKPEQDIQIPLH